MMFLFFSLPLLLLLRQKGEEREEAKREREKNVTKKRNGMNGLTACLPPDPNAQLLKEMG